MVLVSTTEEYKMTVIPQSMFVVNGSLLVYKEKSDHKNIIENVTVESKGYDDTPEAIKNARSDRQRYVFKKTTGTVTCAI